MEPEQQTTEQPLVHINLSHPILEETKSFIEAPESVYSLKEQLIREHPQSIGCLAGVPIKILLDKKTRIQKGRVILGKASTFSERDLLLHPYRFLIKLNHDYWHSPDANKEALLFHELMHCDVDDEGKCGLRSHDLEEFTDVIRHYGIWEQSIKDFAEQLQSIDP